MLPTGRIGRVQLATKPERPHDAKIRALYVERQAFIYARRMALTWHTAVFSAEQAAELDRIEAEINRLEMEEMK